MLPATQLQQDPVTGRFLPNNCLASKKAIYQSPDVLQAAIDDYFDQYLEKEMPTTVTTMSLFLGFTGRQGLHDYLARPPGSFNGGASPYPDIIKRAKARIEGDRLEKMLTNKNNVIAGIFDLKNNFGYIDKQVSESSIKVQQVAAPEDVAALKALALQMIEQQEDDALLIEGDVSHD